MKQLLLLAFTAIMMAGCGEYENDGAPLIRFNTIVIDSCEYLRGYQKMAHKGNCKFCAERRQQEMIKLIKALEHD